MTGDLSVARAAAYIRIMGLAPKARLGWLGIALALAFLGFGLALAGAWSTAADARSSAGDVTADASRTARVEIAGFAFKPATVRIGKGSSVSFSNTSDATHTATRAGSFDTGRIKPGKAATVRFTRKGSFPYHCTIHPFMKGKVVVE
jgi:plastocyanin